MATASAFLTAHTLARVVDSISVDEVAGVLVVVVALVAKTAVDVVPLRIFLRVSDWSSDPSRTCPTIPRIR